MDLAKIERLIRETSKCSNTLDSYLRDGPIARSAIQAIYFEMLSKVIVSIR